MTRLITEKAKGNSYKNHGRKRRLGTFLSMMAARTPDASLDSSLDWARICRSLESFVFLSLAAAISPAIHVSNLSAQNGFVGAKACEPCHAEQFNKQSRSNHAKALHPAAELVQF